MNLYKTSVWLLIFVFLFSGISLAGFPVPSGSRLKQEETAEVDGAERKMSIYETDLNEEAVINFYKKELPRKDYNLFLEQKNTAVFLKGEEMFMLVITPSKEGKRQFIITTAQRSSQVGRQPVVCEGIPAVPVYPGAQCMRSMRMRSRNSRTVNYLIKAPLEEVLSFYRTKMPLAMWNLEKEIDAGKYLPEGGPSDNIISWNLGTAKQLVFKNSKEEVCMITLMDSPLGGGTLISIIYEAK